MKTSDITISIFIIIIFILLYVFNILSVGIKQIEQDWPQYRCNPIVMPFASVFGHDTTSNFTFCIQNMMKSYMGYLLQPLHYNFSIIGNIGKTITTGLEDIRQFFNNIRNFITSIVQSVFGVFLNILIEFQRVIINIKDIFGKLIGIMATLMYTLEGSIDTMNSAWNGPPGQLVRGLCFHPDTKIALKNGDLVKMKDIKLNSILKNDTKVVAVMNISNISEKGEYNETLYSVKDGENDEPVGDEIKCDTDIDVIGYPIKEYEKIDLKLDLPTEFNFLTIAQVSPRKNISATVRSFINEFKDDDKVGLVMKINKVNDSLMDRHTVTQEIKNIIKTENLGDIKCKIYILHGPMSEQEIHSLYKQENIHAYITTTHGEGYGLPLFEAAYNGLPVVMHNWSGQSDFLYIPQANGKRKPMFATVEYELQNVQKEAVWDGVIQADSQWAFPLESSFKKRLREVRTGYTRFKRNATKLKKHLVENFTEEIMYDSFCQSILENPNDKSIDLESLL